MSVFLSGQCTCVSHLAVPLGPPGCGIPGLGEALPGGELGAFSPSPKRCGEPGYCWAEGVPSWAKLARSFRWEQVWVLSEVSSASIDSIVCHLKCIRLVLFVCFLLFHLP